MSAESKKERFFRLFNPFVLLGFGTSVYAMGQMVQASRKQDNHNFQKAQRLRMVSSLGAVLSLVIGYVLKNQDRMKNDFAEITERWQKSGSP